MARLSQSQPSQTFGDGNPDEGAERAGENAYQKNLEAVTNLCWFLHISPRFEKSFTEPLNLLGFAVVAPQSNKLGSRRTPDVWTQLVKWDCPVTGYMQGS